MSQTCIIDFSKMFLTLRKLMTTIVLMWVRIPNSFCRLPRSGTPLGLHVLAWNKLCRWNYCDWSSGARAVPAQSEKSNFGLSARYTNNCTDSFRDFCRDTYRDSYRDSNRISGSRLGIPFGPLCYRDTWAAIGITTGVFPIFAQITKSTDKTRLQPTRSSEAAW